MKLAKLDIDGSSIDWRRIRTVLSMFNLKVVLKNSSIKRTTNGFHLYLDLKSKRFIDDLSLCFIQTAMGSDYKREMFNWNRIIYGEGWQKKYWNVLFNQKFYRKGSKIKRVSFERPMPISILKRRLKDYVI